VNIIFESSDRADRADRLIEEAFGDFRIEEGRSAGSGRMFFMPKAAGDPALEVLIS
jgi:hypothetical protein